jgi:hypothetical protein
VLARVWAWSIFFGVWLEEVRQMGLKGLRFLYEELSLNQAWKLKAVEGRQQQQRLIVSRWLRL